MKEISCDVIKDLVVKEAGKGSTRIRVVRWLVDGNDTGTVLEKRNFYTTKEGEERMGKAKGFTREDVSYIVSHWAEIEPLLAPKKP